MTIWGTGPTIVAAAVAYAIPAAVLTALYPDLLAPRLVPPAVSIALGALLIGGGLALLISSGKAISTAFREGELLTTGVYGLVRNPIYSAWIVFIIPGIALALQYWLLLGASLVAYLVFKLTIRREREYLLDLFGEQYRAYEQRVNEIFPWPRRAGRE